MSRENIQNSAGLVETKLAKIQLPSTGLKLENGLLLDLTVAYETYGTLSPNKDNVIFICHALSGDAHVAGYHDDSNISVGWWDEMVGPGKGIDTNIYFVICANILGGCKGTTGPASINPETGKPYGSTFPRITISDMVDVHRLLIKHLEIDRLAAVIGGSLGGMQALEWTIRYPDMIDRCICIAAAASLSTQALAFDIVGRNSITSDPNWQDGDYYGTGHTPDEGLAQARKIGHITYLSPEMMTEKFGREKHDKTYSNARFSTNFQVESYLDHQGNKFVDRFDANSYLHITRAIDEYDLIEKHGSLEKAFDTIKAKVLVIALSSDWLFPPEQSVEIANAMLRAGKQVSYCNLQAPHGHDAFLVDIKNLSEIMKAFLPWVGDGNNSRQQSIQTIKPSEKKEYDNILDMINPGTKVLDLGCGNSKLLSLLADKKNIEGIGVDIDICHVIEAIDSGHDIFQADIDAGMAMIPDDTYDYAILGETLQVVRNPRLVLREMLRVAREGIVSFPNFGKWSHRLHLGITGRMPIGNSLPFEWYETPNIHLFTLRDFVDLCRQDGIKILSTVCMPSCNIGKLLVNMGFRNLGADRVLVKIAR
ncbi:MAG: hypothetical protein A2283_21135 [Lentisphaerae bacterium RIFOXYA12_FULL_48_11]|nr:MAG: hypothetical protein A2283_21135 [Lentisphaerae bacterium RIFOXYA12_FULL_48_11]